jgi:hypothetical protein
MSQGATDARKTAKTSGNRYCGYGVKVAECRVRSVRLSSKLSSTTNLQAPGHWQNHVLNRGARKRALESTGPAPGSLFEVAALLEEIHVRPSGAKIVGLYVKHLSIFVF